MYGFQTIGNATLIVYDGEPLLVTDPWLDGSAYFGSWGATHEIPGEQRDAIQRCKYIWYSHGHPDHLSLDSLADLSNKEILLAAAPWKPGELLVYEMTGPAGQQFGHMLINLFVDSAGYF